MDCIGVIFGREVTRSVYATRPVASDWKESAASARMGEQMRSKLPRAARQLASASLMIRDSRHYYRATVPTHASQGARRLRHEVFAVSARERR